jgi:hypothetical protein
VLTVASEPPGCGFSHTMPWCSVQGNAVTQVRLLNLAPLTKHCSSQTVSNAQACMPHAKGDTLAQRLPFKC